MTERLRKGRRLKPTPGVIDFIVRHTGRPFHFARFNRKYRIGRALPRMAPQDFTPEICADMAALAEQVWGEK